MRSTSLVPAIFGFTTTNPFRNYRLPSGFFINTDSSLITTLAKIRGYDQRRRKPKTIKGFETPQYCFGISSRIGSDDPPRVAGSSFVLSLSGRWPLIRRLYPSRSLTQLWIFCPSFALIRDLIRGRKALSSKFNNLRGGEDRSYA